MTPESWQRNLYAIFVAEFVVIMGFSFVNPFMPLFIQELGTFTNQKAAFWAGIATSASGIAMFFSAPIWGIVADRWGRKPMVLRAMFGAGIVLALIGLAPNIYYIVALRFAQGLLSGTVAAASALVAASTPRNKIPFAMGLLMVAVFAGTSFGPLMGGFMADIVGYKTAFFITGGLLFSGGLIVLFLVKEKFERPAKGQSASLSSLLRLAKSKEMLPLLLALFALHAAPNIITPIISLFIRELNPEGMAATASGLAFSFMGMVAAVSAIITGRLGGRISLKKILVIACLGTGLLYLPPMWAQTVTQLITFIALTGLFKGGLMTSSNALVGLSVPRDQQGIAYGLAQSANALGNGLGPLIGGSLAPLIGLRSVFGVTGGFFMLTGVAVSKLLARVNLEKPPSQKVSASLRKAN
jgi:DHA1 family multidrug resistance protein-like MFS transporter